MMTREQAKNALRRNGFVSRAAELLPNLQAVIDAKASELYGDVGGDRYQKLTARLERRRKAWENFSKGKPFKVDLSGEIPADGHLDARFALCIRALRESKSDIGPVFPLTVDGVAISWPGVHYKFNRGVFIPPHCDDGKVGTLHIAEKLLQAGGLFRLERTDRGFNMLGLAGSVPTWRLLLRVTRELGPRGRAEAIRRVRDGVAFTFQGSGPKDVTAVLSAGRMPGDVRAEYEEKCAIYANRLQRATTRIEELEAEGKTAAEAFAAQPDCHGAQFAAAKQELQDIFKSAQERLMRMMDEVCYKRDVLEVPPTVVPRSWPRTRTGISHRVRARWDAAKASFAAAVEALATAGEVPLEMKADRHGQGVLLTLE